MWKVQNNISKCLLYISSDILKYWGGGGSSSKGLLRRYSGLTSFQRLNKSLLKKKKETLSKKRKTSEQLLLEEPVRERAHLLRRLGHNLSINPILSTETHNQEGTPPWEVKALNRTLDTHIADPAGDASCLAVSTARTARWTQARRKLRGWKETPGALAIADTLVFPWQPYHKSLLSWLTPQTQPWHSSNAAAFLGGACICSTVTEWVLFEGHAQS